MGQEAPHGGLDGLHGARPAALCASHGDQGNEPVHAATLLMRPPSFAEVRDRTRQAAGPVREGWTCAVPVADLAPLCLALLCSLA